MKSWIGSSIGRLALLLGLACMPWAGAPAAREFIAIGTGDVTGVPYHAGGAICSLVNAGRSDHQIRCTAKSSRGSIANIDALRRGERDFGLVQSDLAQQAYRGVGSFADRGEFGGLRVVAALHPETVTLVTRGVDVETVQDLRGKRINLGRRDSGERASLQALLDALGWTPADFAATAELGLAEQVDALCRGEVDAIFFVAGHPNNLVQSALQCGGELVAVSGPAINRMVRNAPYYNATVIPGGVYSGYSQEVATYGVTSLLLSSTNTPRETVFEVTRAIYAGLADLRGWHRALADLGTQRMAGGTRVVDVPLHPGAAMYYSDAGLLQ